LEADDKADKMKCEDICRLISEYLDDGLDLELRGIMREHINLCERCSALLKTMKETISFTRRMSETEKVPDAVINRVYCEIHIRYERRIKSETFAPPEASKYNKKKEKRR